MKLTQKHIILTIGLMSFIILRPVAYASDITQKASIFDRAPRSDVTQLGFGRVPKLDETELGFGRVPKLDETELGFGRVPKLDETELGFGRVPKLDETELGFGRVFGLDEIEAGFDRALVDDQNVVSLSPFMPLLVLNVHVSNEVTLRRIFQSDNSDNDEKTKDDDPTDFEEELKEQLDYLKGLAEEGLERAKEFIKSLTELTEEEVERLVELMEKSGGEALSPEEREEMRTLSKKAMESMSFDDPARQQLQGLVDLGIHLKDHVEHQVRRFFDW